MVTSFIDGGVNFIICNKIGLVCAHQVYTRLGVANNVCGLIYSLIETMLLTNFLHMGSKLIRFFFPWDTIFYYGH